MAYWYTNSMNEKQAPYNGNENLKGIKVILCI